MGNNVEKILAPRANGAVHQEPGVNGLGKVVFDGLPQPLGLVAGEQQVLTEESVFQEIYGAYSQYRAQLAEEVIAVYRGLEGYEETPVDRREDVEAFLRGERRGERLGISTDLVKVLLAKGYLEPKRYDSSSYGDGEVRDERTIMNSNGKEIKVRVTSYTLGFPDRRKIPEGYFDVDSPTLYAYLSGLFVNYNNWDYYEPYIDHKDRAKDVYDRRVSVASG
ncbi:MAG: hypothetical protein HYT83_03230 [Candidatus Levybacteria bacterium]|nr:hypothetical protein [Candidatus Levybacteria bacterium]